MPKKPTQPQQLPLVAIQVIPHLQPRVKLDPDVVADYARIYAGKIEGASLPPIQVWRLPPLNDESEERYLLSQGFTRHAAAIEARCIDVLANVCDGRGLPDATAVIPHAVMLDALGGNRTNGQRLTVADKRRALVLYHEQTPKRDWQPLRTVGDLIGCSHEMVSQYRKELKGEKVEKAKKSPAPETSESFIGDTVGIAAEKDLVDGMAKDPVLPTDANADTSIIQGGIAVKSGSKVVFGDLSEGLSGDPIVITDKTKIPLSTRRLHHERTLIADRIEAKPAWRGTTREQFALLLLIGFDSMTKTADTVWSDAFLQDAPHLFEQQFAHLIADRLRTYHPSLPDHATICRLWHIDHASIRILAERAIPE